MQEKRLAEIIDIKDLIAKRNKTVKPTEHALLDFEINDEDYYTACTLSTDALVEELVSALSSTNGKGMIGLSCGTLVAELVNRLDGVTVILEEAISRYQLQHN